MRNMSFDLTEPDMLDLVYLALGLISFLLFAAAIRFLDRL
jgi:hypothetical protein